MRKFRLITLLITIIPGIALAQGASTECSYGDMVRRVVIMSEPGVSVPCEVHYYKDSEAPGEDQVLWSAGQQTGYCEEKAAGLVAKLEGWGWNCSGEAPAEVAEAPEAPETPDAPEVPEAPEAPEAPEDMTEDLAPAAEDSTE